VEVILGGCCPGGKYPVAVVRVAVVLGGCSPGTLFFTITHFTARTAFCINVPEILTKCGLAEPFEGLGPPICCDYSYLVYVMRRSLFQLLILLLMTNFWNPVKDSSCTLYICSHLCFSFGASCNFLVLYFLQTRRDTKKLHQSGQASAYSKIVVKYINKYAKINHSYRLHLTIISSSSQKFVRIIRGKLKLGNLHLLKAHPNSGTQILKCSSIKI